MQMFLLHKDKWKGKVDDKPKAKGQRHSKAAVSHATHLVNTHKSETAAPKHSPICRGFTVQREQKVTSGKSKTLSM